MWECYLIERTLSDTPANFASLIPLALALHALLLALAALALALALALAATIPSAGAAT